MPPWGLGPQIYDETQTIKVYFWAPSADSNYKKQKNEEKTVAFLRWEPNTMLAEYNAYRIQQIWCILQMYMC